MCESKKACKEIPPYVRDKPVKLFSARILGERGILVGLDACTYFCPVDVVNCCHLEADKNALEAVRRLRDDQRLSLGLPGNQYFETAKAPIEKRERAKEYWGEIKGLPQEIDFTGCRLKTRDPAYERQREEFEKQCHNTMGRILKQKSDDSMQSNAHFYNYPILTVDYNHLCRVRQSNDALGKYVMRPSEFIGVFINLLPRS